MYGILNKGIQDMVIRNHGVKVWEKIKQEANLEEDFFASMRSYDDAISYDLVRAAEKILDTPAHDVLVAFGEYWIEFTAMEGYGNLLSMAGNNFPEFLSNLNDLHVRVGTTYKELKPPSFLCTEIDSNTMLLQYHSHREGLSSLVIGLVTGLGKIFHVLTEIDHIKKREEVGFDEFFIKYESMGNQFSEYKIANNKDTKNGKSKCPFSRFRKTR